MDQNIVAGMIMAGRASHREARSALPDAPVVPDRPGRADRTGRTGRRTTVTRARSALARGLERLARAVEPRPAPAGACQATCTPVP
jgi:hypothetical protein